jgi:thiol-disulfide isomerase/thioredoxin
MNLNDIKNIWAKPISEAKSRLSISNQNLQGLSVDIHNATWCPDCEREVSLLLAINENAQPAFDTLSLHSYEDINVYKEGKVKGTLEISCLPTLIFYRKGEEVLRIEEDSAGKLASQIQALQNK